MNTHSPKMRKIFAQGDLDGACFLYSLVNAYVALTNQDPDFCEVCQAFKQVDFPQDFLCGNTGTTGNYDNRHQRLQNNLERILHIIGDETFETMHIDAPLSHDVLVQGITPKSVLIVRYQGDTLYSKNLDHWVCVVAFEGDMMMHVACSARISEASFEALALYQETYHPESSRWSNDILIPSDTCHLIPSDIFRVTLKEPAAKP